MRYPVVTREEMYALDQRMTNQFGISSQVLMENAANAVFNVLRMQFPDLVEKRILVITGPGHNGEDGLVLSRILKIHQVQTEVLILAASEKWKKSYQEKVRTIRLLGIPLHIQEFPVALEFDIIIDGIFGIGLSRKPEGIFKNAIHYINQSNAFVVSLDIPSGIDANTGETYGDSVHCHICVSFGLIKIGNCMKNGYAHCKELYWSPLNSPYVDDYHADSLPVSLNFPETLPNRSKAGYKNTFGKCLVIGGSSAYHGAPYFAASAFMKLGGGYVHIVSTKEAIQSIAVSIPEGVLHPHNATRDGTLPHDAINDIERLGLDMNVIILGSGLGISPDTQSLVKDIITCNAFHATPIVIDGDALTILAENPGWLKNRKPYTTILTPHPGEMSRLSGLSIQTILGNSLEITKEFSQKWKVFVVLKTARSILVTEKAAVINTSGTDALATAGTGDVLAGMIAALLSSSQEIDKGFCTAVFLHGLVGNILTEQSLNRSATASDVLHTISDATLRLELFAQQQKNRTQPAIPGIRFVP